MTLIDPGPPPPPWVGRPYLKKAANMSNDMASDMVGARISAVYWSEEHLTFQADDGQLFGFTVFGDCCSHSYFHDLIGLEKLLAGTVIKFDPISLAMSDRVGDDNDSDEYVQKYGYRVVTKHPTFGPVTTVFSFRNASNGYYGGWMERGPDMISDDQRKLTHDVVTT